MLSRAEGGAGGRVLRRGERVWGLAAWAPGGSLLSSEVNVSSLHFWLEFPLLVKMPASKDNSHDC